MSVLVQCSAACSVSIKEESQDWPQAEDNIFSTTASKMSILQPMIEPAFLISAFSLSVSPALMSLPQQTIAKYTMFATEKQWEISILLQNRWTEMETAQSPVKVL